MYYENKTIQNLVRIFDQNERKSYLRLDLNENPGGMPEEIVREVLDEIKAEEVAEYPETFPCQKAIADSLGCRAENICLTNGSSEAIRQIIFSHTSLHGKILAVTPSYFMFHVYAEMYERDLTEIPYEEDLTMPVGKILAAMNPEIQLLILVEPNNPMGNVYTKEEFEKILEKARECEITLLIDEAYHYFCEETCIPYALSNPHVFVTRTFSKAFSMAGCRLGYAVGQKEGIELVQKLSTPHNTNVLALKLAEKLLREPEILEGLMKKFREGRAYLIDRLDRNGYLHHGDAGNFLFIQPKTDAQKLVEKMKSEKNILIKSYKNVGCLGACLRVTIGEKKFMERFMDALTELDQ